MAFAMSARVPRGARSRRCELRALHSFQRAASRARSESAAGTVLRERREVVEHAQLSAAALGVATPRAGGSSRVEARERRAELAQRDAATRSAASRRSRRASSGNSRILTAYSIAGVRPTRGGSRVAADRHDGEVQSSGASRRLRRSSSSAEVPAQLERAEVDERQLDRFLDLVGVARRSGRPTRCGSRRARTFVDAAAVSSAGSSARPASDRRARLPARVRASLRGIADSARLAAEQLEQLGRLCRISCCVAAALDVQAQQRLGVRRAQVEAPIGELDAEPVGVDRRRARAACTRPRRSCERRLARP